MIMSWIRTVPEENARGLLATIYEETKAKFGRVINLVKIQSLRPETMAIGRQLYRHLMDSPSGLSRLHRVLIATVVSKANGCLY
jgi:alkylhydroperoxidase family enzyme